MTSAIIKIQPLGSPWETIDPFLVCVHHVDNYPAGNGLFGPDTPKGRDMEGANGWRMYRGRTVPGFPAHPHRGFETITILSKGVVDHADSLGNSARFGQGDVQWLTAGRGIVHSEMFPLLNQLGPNPLELFQIWLNLPARSKMVEPHFKMFWAENIPVHKPNGNDGSVEVRCIVGTSDLANPTLPPAPPFGSWAAEQSADMAIWTIKMAPGAMWTLPTSSGRQTRRQLFFYKGESMTIDGTCVEADSAIEVRCSEKLQLVNGSRQSEVVMLQGRPIGEPIVQNGPFVMNSNREIEQAYDDFQSTRFGSWDWPRFDPVHQREKSRFESR
jgi:redox-sensitive bicupin YhaK (pirin superfamily)